jgi:hypothetical protein
MLNYKFYWVLYILKQTNIYSKLTLYYQLHSSPIFTLTIGHLLSDEFLQSKTMDDVKRARRDDYDAMHVGEEQFKDEEFLDKNESSDVDDKSMLSHEEIISEDGDESLDSKEDDRSIGEDGLAFRQLSKRRVEQDDPSLLHIEIDKYHIFPHA